jgi:DNA-directed RNA polymerase sigma subunit (sigma70/sigma32)
VTREFFNENERNPTPHEIADIIREKFNFTINNLQDVELGNVISIEEKYSVMDDNSLENTTFFSKMTSTNNIQEDIEKQYQKHKLDFFLGKLSKRERTVVEKYYGIGCEQESFSTIGLQLNLGGERVRQICVEAVKKMKDYKSLIKD